MSAPRGRRARSARRHSAIVAIAALALCGQPVLAQAQSGASAPASPEHAVDRAPSAAPAAAREPAARAGAATGEPTESLSPSATMQPVGPEVPRLPPRLDGSRFKLPPMVIAQDRPGVDRRPIYLGAGLIVLAAVFWWNRRRRDRFEREDGTAPARPARRPDADADADDLHAAARGEGPETGHPNDEPDPP